MNTVSINVSTPAAGQGLKEDLTRAAHDRGLTVNKVVAAIYQYAVDHRDKFSTPLLNSRLKGGLHISASVSPNLREALNEWAKTDGKHRSLLCCFILEKTLEAKLLDTALTYRPHALRASERKHDGDDKDDE